MKKIIGGKKYDTETATLIGSKDNGLCPYHRSYKKESLYRKVTGEFFFLREWPNNIYRTSLNECCCFRQKDIPDIDPTTEKNARAWAEQYMSADVFEATFGEVAE